MGDALCLECTNECLLMSQYQCSFGSITVAKNADNFQKYVYEHSNETGCTSFSHQ